MMKHYRPLEYIVLILLLVGGLNWGFIGLFKWDVVASIFGEMSGFTRVLYSLVGLAAVARIAYWVSCSQCKK
jgi:uncharacterized membrane protein YuzA (DUF378 family)